MTDPRITGHGPGTADVYTRAPMIEVGDRLAGAVWGHLVADAVGVPYEFGPAVPVDKVTLRGGGPHGQPPGTWSDDGALMLALLDSLLSAGFDTDDQGRRALGWADDGAYTPNGEGRFDIGGATARALARLRSGTPAEQAGGTSDRDQGNGSLMRILPVALVYRDADAETLIGYAHRASRVTHGHPVAQAACALYCLSIQLLLAGAADPEQALAGARSTLRGHYTRGTDGPRFLVALDVIEAWEGRSGRGWVVDSFWSAWDAFAGADSYRSTVQRAVAYGNDTDTTACIAGGLAGAYWGVRTIPQEWLAALRGREIVEPLVARLIGG